jgi:hypothetical protein
MSIPSIGLGKDERLTYSVSEGARKLGVSPFSIYKEAKRGSPLTIKIGGRVLVVKAVLDKMLSAG